MEENEAQQSPQIQMSSAYVSMAEDQLLIGEPPKINESREMWLRLNQNLALFCAFYSLIVAAVYVVMCSTSGRPTFLVPMLLSLLNYTCSLLVIWRIYPELRKYAGTSRDYRTDPQLNHRERAGSLISYGQLAIVGFLSGIFGVYTIVADVYKEESGWMLWASIIFSFISYGLTRVKEIYCKELYSTILRADEFCWSATFLCSVVVTVSNILEMFTSKLWWLDAVCVIVIGWFHLMRFGVKHFQSIHRSKEWDELELDEEEDNDQLV